MKRQARAHETRERTLAAARAEFVTRGYAATTVRRIAAAAGVSVPTVELIFGTKAQLLRATISFAIRGDGEPLPMLQRSWALRAQETTSVEAFLAIVGRVLVEAEQRSAGLVVAAFEAANQDSSLASLADQLHRQRAETAAWIVEGVHARAALRAELTRERAIDIVWLLMDPHAFQALTRDRGWAPEQFEAWFSDSLRRLLLAQDARRPAG